MFMRKKISSRIFLKVQRFKIETHLKDIVEPNELCRNVRRNLFSASNIVHTLVHYIMIAGFAGSYQFSRVQLKTL